MRLCEFDNLDRSSHNIKFGTSIETYYSNIQVRCNKIFKEEHVLRTSARGRSILESESGDTMHDIAELFEFYNMCNDDAETRQYLDMLVELNDKLAGIIDSIK